MQLQPQYPSPEHAQAAKDAAQFFTAEPVSAVLLIGACTRGQATRDSDLDILVLVAPAASETEKTALWKRWEHFEQHHASFQDLRKVGKYAELNLEVSDGHFAPKPRGWTSGPDNFELEIGNTLVYSVPLLERDEYLQKLQKQWLPYYAETLRRERLAMVRRYCQNNLDHIQLYVDRGLYFQSFDRLYKAFQEFLQAIFIGRRTYPIAYDKWIREQVEETLGLPDLYQHLPKLFEIRRFESNEIADKAMDIGRLLKQHASE